MQNKLVSAGKIVIVAAILGYLVYQNQDPIYDLWVRKKDPVYLAVSFFMMLTAVCLSFGRWFLLVRALEIRFTLTEAFRFGFVGYLFNFVGPSAVGGDVLKAVLLARNQTERRAEAVATILLDRVLGVYALLLVATPAILLSGATELDIVGPFLWIVVAAALGSTCGGCLLMLPGRYSQGLTSRLARLPWVGPLIGRVTIAIDMYRKRMPMLLLAIFISIVSHIGLALTVRFADLAVYPKNPTLFEHLIISPLSSIAAAAPLPGGMGTFELAMDSLFAHIPSVPMEKGQGLAVAVIYRLVTVGVAMLGVVFYFAYKAEVDKASEDAENSGHA